MPHAARSPLAPDASKTRDSRGLSPDKWRNEITVRTKSRTDNNGTKNRDASVGTTLRGVRKLGLAVQCGRLGEPSLSATHANWRGQSPPVYLNMSQEIILETEMSRNISRGPPPHKLAASSLIVDSSSSLPSKNTLFRSSHCERMTHLSA